jgi:Transglutaminase-like superfamily
MTRRLLPALPFALALAFLWLAAAEAVTQKREDDYVRAEAAEAVRGLPEGDFDARLAALRDYVRARVHNIDFPARGRPFLRDTAADTLRTGKGRCGEASRAFVNLARAAGIRAQRLYLDGPRPHVLTVVRPGDGRRLVVDPYETPYVPEVEPLDNLLAAHTEFASYSTLGFRRLSLLRSLPSNELPLGPLNYLFENPHALASFLWFFASALALTLAELINRRVSRAPSTASRKPLPAAAA